MFNRVAPTCGFTAPQLHFLVHLVVLPGPEHPSPPFLMHNVALFNAHVSSFKIDLPPLQPSNAKPPRPACYVSGVQLLGAVDNHRIEAALDVAHRPCSSSSNSIRALALHSDMNIDKVDNCLADKPNIYINIILFNFIIVIMRIPSRRS